MKRLIIITAILLNSIPAAAQILKPVSWSYGAKKINSTEAVVFIKATIDEGWHIYSQTVKDGGPIKTTFTFQPSKEFTLSGKTIEPKPVSRMEKAFNMEVAFFETSVIFQQKIKLKAGKVNVKGSLQYMTCNDHQCLPPEDVEFTIPIN